MGLFKDKTNYILVQTMNHWQKGRKQSLLPIFCAYIYIYIYINIHKSNIDQFNSGTKTQFN